MADNEDVASLGAVKQALSGVRFESEAVRTQIEAMLARYNDVADVMSKTRQLTEDENRSAQRYLATVSQIGDVFEKLGSVRLSGMNEATKGIIGLEQALARYEAQADKAARVSERLSQKLKGARKEAQFTSARDESAKASMEEAKAKLVAFQALRSSGGEITQDKLREFGLGHVKGLSPGRAEGALAASFKARKQEAEDAAKAAQESTKRIDRLKTEKSLVDRIHEKELGRAKSAEGILKANEKLLPRLQKGLDVKRASAKTEKESEQREERAYRRRDRLGERHGMLSNLAVNLASDVGVPGLSTLARMERYRRLTSAGLARMGGGDEGVGGGAIRALGRGALRAGAGIADFGDRIGGRLGGMLGGAGGAIGRAGGELRQSEGIGAGGALGLIGSPLGLALGAGAVGAGFLGNKVYQAMGRAEGMAPGQMALRGQVGLGGMPGANAAYQQDLTRYGYSIQENQGALLQLNRQVGGKAGPGQLKDISRLAYGYGQDRGELGGQAGALVRSGGAAPATAAKALERIMSEGVRAGMDRARITEFTSEVVGLQQEIFRETGKNNAESIAKSLGQLMQASHRSGQEFFNSPLFQGLTGLDRGLKSFARGGSGPGAGTIYRGLKPFAEGQTLSDRYVSTMERAEGGIFGGKGTSGVQTAKAIIGQYFKESGGGDLFARKSRGDALSPEEQRQLRSASNVVRTRLSMEQGVGFQASKELIEALENIGQGSKDGDARLAAVLKDQQEEQKEPLERLATSMKQAEDSLTRIATGGAVLKAAIVKNEAEAAVNSGLQKSGALDLAAGTFSSAAGSFSGAVKDFSSAVDAYKRGESLLEVGKALLNPAPAAEPSEEAKARWKKQDEGSISGATLGAVMKIFDFIAGIDRSKLPGAGKDAAPPRADIAPAAPPPPPSAQRSDPAAAALASALERNTQATERNTTSQSSAPASRGPVRAPVNGSARVGQ